MHTSEPRTLDLPACYADQRFAERLIGRPAPLHPMRRPVWAALCAVPASLLLLSATVALFGGPAPI